MGKKGKEKRSNSGNNKKKSKQEDDENPPRSQSKNDTRSGKTNGKKKERRKEGKAAKTALAGAQRLIMIFDPSCKRMGATVLWKWMLTAIVCFEVYRINSFMITGIVTPTSGMPCATISSVSQVIVSSGKVAYHRDVIFVFNTQLASCYS